MDFTLDKITSPFYPFFFSLEGRAWSSVAEYACVKTLPEKKQAQMKLAFDKHVESVRPWHGLHLMKEYHHLMVNCINEWISKELDLFWTHLLNKDENAQARLLSTGKAVLSVPDIPGAGEILMMHRERLEFCSTDREERVRIFSLLSADFLKFPRMKEKTFKQLQAEYGSRNPVVSLPNDSIILYPDDMVALLKKRYFALLREEGMNQVEEYTAKLMLTHMMEGSSEQTIKRELLSMKKVDAIRAGKEILTSLSETIPEACRRKIDAMLKGVITAEEVEEAEKNRQLQFLFSADEDASVAHELDVDIVSPLVTAMKRHAQMKALNIVTLYFGDPLLPDKATANLVLERAIKRHIKGYEPRISDWDEGKFFIFEHMEKLFRRNFDEASNLKWQTPSFAKYLIHLDKTYNYNSGYPWAGYLIDKSLEDIRKHYSLPQFTALQQFKTATVAWNAESFLKDPLLRAFLRLKVSLLVEIFHIYLPRDKMNRKMAPLFQTLNTEEKVVGAVFGKLPELNPSLPDSVTIAFIQQFAQGYSSLVIWTLLNSFCSRLPFHTLSQYVEYIIKTQTYFTASHFLDEPTSKAGINYLSRHTHMIPAHCMSLVTPQICWKRMKPGSRALIIAFIQAEQESLNK